MWLKRKLRAPAHTFPRTESPGRRTSLKEVSGSLRQPPGRQQNSNPAVPGILVRGRRRWYQGHKGESWFGEGMRTSVSPKWKGRKEKRWK